MKGLTLQDNLINDIKEDENELTGTSSTVGISETRHVVVRIRVNEGLGIYGYS